MTRRLEPHMPLPLGRWRDRAKCRDAMDPEFFFPTSYTNDGIETEWVRDVRQFCIDCPVAEQCLQEAIDNGDTHGMYGGLTPAERAQIRRQRGRKLTPIQHGTKKGFDAHKRRGQDPCHQCRVAYNADKRQQRARKKASA